jgi:hypothetical protein
MQRALLAALIVQIAGAAGCGAVGPRTSTFASCTEATDSSEPSRPPRSDSLDSSGPAPLEPLAWLARAWASWDEAEQACTVEAWQAPFGTTMMGASSTVAGGRTVAWEHLRLEARPEGVFYVATPSGQQVTEFRLADSGVDTYGADFAIFENPEHDFPVRIIYRREGTGLAERLRARVEGRDPSQAAEWSFRPDWLCPDDPVTPPGSP